MCDAISVNFYFIFDCMLYGACESCHFFETIVHFKSLTSAVFSMSRFKSCRRSIICLSYELKLLKSIGTWSSVDFDFGMIIDAAFLPRWGKNWSAKISSMAFLPRWGRKLSDKMSLIVRCRFPRWGTKKSFMLSNSKFLRFSMVNG